VSSSCVDPASSAGASIDKGTVPQILCTAGPSSIDTPKVTRATSMCERFCSGRSTASSNTAPTTTSASGTTTSAAQKLSARPTV